MQATIPHVEVPGDRFWNAENGTKIMQSLGSCVGMSDKLAVWRFGFVSDSPMDNVFGFHIEEGRNEFAKPRGFLWVLATRKTGKVKETFRGYALELPNHFRKVIEWQP